MAISRIASLVRSASHHVAEKSPPIQPIPTSIARRAIAEATTVFKSAGEKPLPKLVPIYVNPVKESIEERIGAKMETEKTGITHFYHGTHHIDSILEQAQTNPEGKLNRRACDRGDDGLGLYGTGCPKETAYYSGAKFIVRVASDGDVHFDPARGTPALKAFDDKHVMEVFEVENRDEILSHKRPSVLLRTVLAANAALSVIPKKPVCQETRELFIHEMDKPLSERV